MAPVISREVERAATAQFHSQLTEPAAPFFEGLAGIGKNALMNQQRCTDV